MSNVRKITAEETKKFGQPRYHFVVHWTRPIYGKMSSKSIGTWASKQGALKAGKRNFTEVEV